jgi:hypothetical protein
MYIWEIRRLHEIYGVVLIPRHLVPFSKGLGPIVRISPYELHIIDPEFYDYIYASSSHPRDKYEWQINSGNSAQAMGFTVSHELHRRRRQAIDHYFSTQSVRKLDWIIQKHINTLCIRIEEHLNNQTPIDLTLAFLALTMDIIEEYSFGQSSGLLKRPGFCPEWRDTITSIMSNTALLNHCSWIPKLIGLLPERLFEVCNGSLATMNSLKRVRHTTSFYDRS